MKHRVRRGKGSRVCRAPRGDSLYLVFLWLRVSISVVSSSRGPINGTARQVVDSLIKNKKDFEFVFVPNGGHGVGESDYLFRRRQDFFVRSLLDVEPRR